MEAVQRRKEMMRLLQMDMKPMSASNLGEHFNVSRQVIVGDIALLRAGGQDIMATPRGYVLNKKGNESPESSEDESSYVIACLHDKSRLETELYLVLHHGATFRDVSVDHPLYGTITQDLNIRSQFDADAFIKKVAMSGAQLLCALTDDIHLHSIHCPSPETYRRILVDLKEKGILYIK